MRKLSDPDVKITKKDKFITYMEEDLHYINSETGQEIKLPRAGVWAYGVKDKFNVIDTGDDIKQLQSKYNIPDNMVFNEKK